MNVAVFALSGALVGGAVSGAAWAAGGRHDGGSGGADPRLIHGDGVDFVVGEDARVVQVGDAGNTGVPAPAGVTPGAPIVSLLEGGGSVVVEYPRQVSLAEAPADATHVRVTVTCLTPGGLYWGLNADGNNPSSWCTASDTPESSVSWFDFDLAAGRTLYLAPQSGSFAVSWQFLNLIETAWGVTDTGETYGVAKDDGRTPDLIAVIGTAPDGSSVDGFARWSDMEGPMPANPKEAATWQSEARDVPVFAPDGVTQLGVFTVGG
jgi:hypothetical protein